MTGCLFVVATPIGNLEDITLRALRTLKEVDLIAAEDTRRTMKLLAHYEVRKPLVSVHEHNEYRESPKLVARLREGATIALVTDAGTPGIADPGARLVRTARQAGIPVVPIPGPSAVAAALSVSGFEGDEFVFMGFPPRGGTERSAWLTRLAADPRIVVFFEAPHRIYRTIHDVTELLANRPMKICREISKTHEEFISWPNTEDLSSIEERGEFVFVVGKAPPVERKPIDEDAVGAFIGQLIEHARVDNGTALRIAACYFHISERDAAKAVKRHRIALDQRARGRS